MWNARVRTNELSCSFLEHAPPRFKKPRVRLAKKTERPVQGCHEREREREFLKKCRRRRRECIVSRALAKTRGWGCAR